MRAFLEWITAALLVGGLVALLGACSDEARVTFKSCAEATQAGVPLPLTSADVGWNARLDTDKDGLACE